MKAAFLNDSTSIADVYPEDLVDEMKSIMDLYHVIVSKSTICIHKEALKSTEAIFSTYYFDVTDADEPISKGNPLLSLPNAHFFPAHGRLHWQRGS